MEGYIIPHRALKKLRACKSIGNVAYIFGATGFGKTELVREYLKNKQYMYISCADSLWNYTELVNSIGSGKTQSIVVIDDLYLLLNEEKRRDVIELQKRIWRLPAPMLRSILNTPVLSFRRRTLLGSSKKARATDSRSNMPLSR